jgi:hypothetical protein
MKRQNNQEVNRRPDCLLRKVIQYLLAERAARIGKSEIAFSNVSIPAISAGDRNPPSSKTDFPRLKLLKST